MNGPFDRRRVLVGMAGKHRACVVVVMSLTRVMSLLTRISWQLVQPMAIAE